jgi:parvulin-like peptidyl-prolyl isomerase
MMSQDTAQVKRPSGAYLDSNYFGIDEKNLIFANYKGGQLSLGDFLQRYILVQVGRRPALNDAEGLKQFTFQTLMSELLEKEALRLRLDNKKSYTDTLRKLREKMMADKLRNDLLLAPITVNEEEIKAYYDNHKDQFMHPVQVRVQEIMLKSEADAQAVLKQLKAGASFGKLARQKTLRANYKEKGGDLGYFSQTQFPGLFNACQNLKVGELAGPIIQGGSFSVIKFLGRKEPAQKTYEEAQKEAETKALTEKKQQLYTNWIASRKALIKVEVNAELLAQKLEQEFAKLDQTPGKKTISGSFPFKVRVGPGGVIEQVK